MAGASWRRLRAAVAGAVVSMGAAACNLGGGGVTPIRTSFNRGVYLYNNRDYDGAIHQFRQAVDSDAADYRARVNLGLAYEAKAGRAMRQGDEAAVEQARRLRSLARAQYEAALQIEPASLRAAVNLAALTWEKGNHEKAQQELEALAEAHRADALPLVSLGALLLKQGADEAAERALAQAVARDPAHPDANALLAEALRRQGRIDAAREALERAIATEESDVGLHVALGRLELEAEQAQRAVAALTRATYIDPDHVEAQVLLATALERAGRLEEAAGWLIRAKQRLGPGAAEQRELERRLDELYRRLLAAPAEGVGGVDDSV